MFSEELGDVSFSRRRGLGAAALKLLPHPPGRESALPQSPDSMEEVKRVTPRKPPLQEQPRLLQQETIALPEQYPWSQLRQTIIGIFQREEVPFTSDGLDGYEAGMELSHGADLITISCSYGEDQVDLGYTSLEIQFDGDPEQYFYVVVDPHESYIQDDPTRFMTLNSQENELYQKIITAKGLDTIDWDALSIALDEAWQHGSLSMNGEELRKRLHIPAIQELNAQFMVALEAIRLQTNSLDNSQSYEMSLYELLSSFDTFRNFLLSAGILSEIEAGQLPVLDDPEFFVDEIVESFDVIEEPIILSAGDIFVPKDE